MERLLFVCTHNAGRSQMSQAFFASAAAGTALEGRSAGTRPAARVDPTVVEAMAELGYDISGNEPAPLTAEISEWADTFVTMGCGDACPAIPGTLHIEWDLDDPRGRPLEEVREIRDEIRGLVARLVAELSGASSERCPASGE